MHTAGDDVVACAFRGGLDHHGGFDLDKAVVGEVTAHGLHDLVLEENVLHQRGTAQVEVTVFKPNLLSGLAVVGDLKSGGDRLVENAQFGDSDFDVACGNVGVLGRTLPHCSHRRQHKFAAAGLGFFKNRAVGGLVKGKLQKTGAVAQVDEDETSLVALLLHPAADGNRFSDVFGSQLAAVVAALKPCQCF